MRLLTAIRHNLWWRGPLHRFIAWYLRRCGNAFHVYKYGEKGRYVCLLTEHRYDSLEQDMALDRFLNEQLAQSSRTADGGGE